MEIEEKPYTPINTLFLLCTMLIILVTINLKLNTEFLKIYNLCITISIATIIVVGALCTAVMCIKKREVYKDYINKEKVKEIMNSMENRLIFFTFFPLSCTYLSRSNEFALTLYIHLVATILNFIVRFTIRRI